MKKAVFAVLIVVLLVASTGFCLPDKKLNPAGVPAPGRVQQITLSCRNGQAKEVVQNQEQVSSFISSLNAVPFWTTDKVTGPVAISIRLKSGVVINPGAYLDGRIVFGTKHYKLGQAWLDRPFCGR